MRWLLPFLILLPSISTYADESPGETGDIPGPDTPIVSFEKKSARTIQYYKPIYFAYGRPTTKLNFSFRSQLLEKLPFNFAYSQTIFWDLQTKSSPFLDATYNPEFFYRWELGGKRWPALDIGLWEHNSNGKGGSDSRSYDQSYLRGTYAIGGKTFKVDLALKLKVLYHLDETNSDIREYVGPLDMDLRFVQLLDYPWLDQTGLILSLRPGGKYATKISHGGYQAAMNFHVKGIKINPAFYLQYYQGYAESLVNYNEKVRVFRVGLMF